MNRYHDQTYLLNSQYKDATNFGARVRLHRRFSTNKYGWYRWVFDHFKLDEGSSVLEVGCGPGLLWLSNRHRIPASWQISLTDFSPGMLQEAREWLGEERFVYEVADAQALPFADARFDAVIANHMLYHVPDLPRALTEIQRVLKPGGHFYASTIGLERMHELDELIWQCWPSAELAILRMLLACLRRVKRNPILFQPETPRPLSSSAAPIAPRTLSPSKHWRRRRSAARPPGTVVRCRPR